MESKVGNRHLQERVLAVLKEKPDLLCGVEHVRKEIGASWPTARAILMDLALEGRVQVVRTRRGTLFTVPK
jgi:hypothetical protein